MYTSAVSVCKYHFEINSLSSLREMFRVEYLTFLLDLDVFCCIIYRCNCYLRT